MSAVVVPSRSNTAKAGATGPRAIRVRESWATP